MILKNSRKLFSLKYEAYTSSKFWSRHVCFVRLECWDSASRRCELHGRKPTIAPNLTKLRRRECTSFCVQNHVSRRGELNTLDPAILSNLANVLRRRYFCTLITLKICLHRTGRFHTLSRAIFRYRAQIFGCWIVRTCIYPPKFQRVLFFMCMKQNL
jgi:hypothetical protein